MLDVEGSGENTGNKPIEASFVILPPHEGEQQTIPQESSQQKQSRLAAARERLRNARRITSSGFERAIIAASSGVEKAKNAADIATSKTAEFASRAVEQGKPKAQAIAKKTGEFAAQAPARAENLVLKSRESRLRTEEENKRSPVQKFFGKGILGFAAKTAVEMIPSPAGYGPGDIITGMSALLGKDVLTGDKLDWVDRGLYGVATVIPFVPSTFLVTPARIVRRSFEEGVHGRRQADLNLIKNSTQEGLQAAKDIGKAIKDARNK